MGKPNELVEAALNHVYTDFDEYVKDQAKEHTVANLGQELSDFARGSRADTLVAGAFYQLRCNYAAEMGDDGDAVMDEYKSWLKEAKKNCGRVKKAGLPWTLQNSRDAFEQRGHFKKEKTK